MVSDTERWRFTLLYHSTVGSVTCHRRLWTEHPQYFVAASWTSFQTRIQYFWCLLGHFDDKTEPILCSVTLIFAHELGPIVFTTITGHTLWTYGWNGTVLTAQPMLTVLLHLHAVQCSKVLEWRLTLGPSVMVMHIILMPFRASMSGTKCGLSTSPYIFFLKLYFTR